MYNTQGVTVVSDGPESRSFIFFFVFFIFLVFSTPAAPPSPPLERVDVDLQLRRNGSHSGHSVLPALVDGGDGGHRKPTFLCCPARLGIPAHHAEV